MDERVSATTFICESLGMKNPGIYEALAHDANCAFCGRVIPKGEGALKAAYSSGFNDFNALAAISSKYACWACDAMGHKLFMQKYSKALITSTGVYGLAKSDDLALLLVNPPEAPFVAYISDAQQQHLAWRTPITVNRDRLIVRVGDTLHTMRRPAMLEGAEAMRRLVGAVNTHAKESSSSKSKLYEMKHIYLNYKTREDSTNVTVSDKVLDYLSSHPGDTQSKQDFEFLMALSHSEVWGVVRIVMSNIDWNAPPERTLVLNREMAPTALASSTRLMAFA